MKKLKLFIIVNLFSMLILSNIFGLTLASKYKNLDKLIKPIITLKKNKLGNSEGIYFNPFMIYSKDLKVKGQNDYQKGHLILVAGIFFLMIYKKKEPDYYGSAKFADREDIEKMKVTENPDDGVVLGKTKDNKIITHNGSEHIMAMAPTRSGKGINTVLTTLWTWISSVIVNDIKGECWDLTSGYRRTVLKQKCIFFNPMDETGEGISYNPLALVKVGTRAEQEDARTVATTLLDVDGKGETDHWISSAINLLTAVILHVKYVNKDASFLDIMKFLEDPKEPLIDKIGGIIAKELNDFGDVVDKTVKDNEGNPIETLKPFNHFQALRDQGIDNLDFLELYMQETTLHPLAGSTFATIFATPDKERGSIFSTCINKLGIFKDPRIMRNVAKSDIVPKDLMKERISLYLITPPKAIDMTKPLFRLIITQTIYELTDKMEFNNRRKIDKEAKGFNFNEIKDKVKEFFFKKPKVDLDKMQNKRLLFLIDEFPALGNLSLVEKALAYIAGYGLKVLMITQSVNQLNKIYGKENSILDNCHSQLYFTPNDKDTPKMISDMMGNKTEKVITRSGSGMGLKNRSESYTGRPLMTPGEIRTLPFEEIILFITGHNPIHGKKIMWWKENRYKNNANYNIPYKSYLRLLKMFEDEGVDEYTLDYLIYLKKSYKALKVITTAYGEKNFVKSILENEELKKRLLVMSEKLNKEKIKLDILYKTISKKKYKDEADYNREIKEYLKDFSDEDLEKYLKIEYFKTIKKVDFENMLERNLKHIEESLDKGKKLEMDLIEFLKEKGVSDSMIPTVPKTFIELLLEKEIPINTVTESFEENIITEETDSGRLVTEFYCDFHELKNQILSKNERKKNSNEMGFEMEEI